MLCKKHCDILSDINARAPTDAGVLVQYVATNS